LGHLLIPPTTKIGKPLFGMALDISPFHPCSTTWWAYELAAMDISRRLLVACGRPDLFHGSRGELQGTDEHIWQHGSRALARRIRRRRGALRLPSHAAARDTPPGRRDRHRRRPAARGPGSPPRSPAPWNETPTQVFRVCRYIQWLVARHQL